MAKLKLKDSPRLWMHGDTKRDLQVRLHSPWMKETAVRILADADWLVRARPLAEGEHTNYMHGSRLVASHLRTLVSAWALTYEPKYRRAGIKHLASLLNWNHISCEATFNTPADAQMFFCLEYGAQSEAIGVMYDFFRQTITPEEQQVFFDVLDKFHLEAALRCLDEPPWWAFKEWSNWNGVCCGGMGQMALAFYEDRPECRKLIPFVEASLGEYFKSYIKNGGGCHEGTGYWNFAMMYAIPYVLSWENATGRRHPAFQIKEIAKSLNFPTDFTGITFGDNDGWGPGGFFFKAAARLNQPKAAMRAAAYLPKAVDPKPRRRNRLDRTDSAWVIFAADDIPTSEEIEACQQAHTKKPCPVARVYEGLGWASLADDSAFPALRLSARGGSSEIAGHGMMDLLSFKCMVNGERMITDQAGGTWVSYTKRGHHLYDRSAASKSTLFVDGLGCMEDAVCDASEVVKGDGLLGIRIDGSHIYLLRWKQLFIGRLFLLVDNAYWLVIDRVHDPGVAAGHSIESRFHTVADVKTGKRSAVLKANRQKMAMTFAAAGGGVMQESLGMPSLPSKQTHIIRWLSAKCGHSLLHVTAMNPGSRKLGLELIPEARGGYTITVIGKDGYEKAIRLTRTLKLKK